MLQLLRALPFVLAPAFAFVPRAATPQGESPGRPPVSVFADLEGTWSGAFVGYDETGKELYRIRVRQTYTTVDETRLKKRNRTAEERIAPTTPVFIRSRIVLMIS